MICRGVRGATTVEQTDRESVLVATRELLATMIRLNGIDRTDVASAIFTTTTDITSVFPATAARQLGWLDVPLMCGTDKAQDQIQHIYLHGAKVLRPDKTIVLSEKDIEELNRWIDQQLAMNK